MTLSQWSNKVFQEDINYLGNYFIAYDGRAKFATTHCECLCPAGVVASPLGHWPATQVFPGWDLRNSSWTTRDLICPQNLNNLRMIYNSLLIPVPSDPYLFASEISAHSVSKLFIIWKFIMTVGKNIRTSPGIIHTRSKILIPDPKSSSSSNNFKNLFICIYSVAKLHLLNCVWRIRLLGGSEWLIDFIN